MALWAQIKSWLAAPFTTPLDTLQIALITGVVIISAFAWQRILIDIEGVSREI
jgi:hypothetical protein